ncbi:SDR family oxidoreductase [Synechococcus sp. A15-28]|jgi:nucleoside-diphosphate-sugar epimerase|uniref:SDR family oxidoreductase n=1 Tax=Synechococcus sp. A15-28 TaxID=1050638 RepID=UPI001647D17E|nr:SDR family oxidoreductase [Synechococcus sp. A15-28]
MLSDLVNRSQPLRADARVLVLGGGYSGGHVARLLRALGTTVRCSRRHLDGSEADLIFDSATGQIPTADDLDGITHVLSTIPPTTEGQDPVLTHLGSQLRERPLIWVGYLSTTGVYGDRRGEWVSEEDPADPGQPRSERRHACEQAWLDSGLPVQILRLPGIYGPGRSVLNSLQTGKARRILKADQVFCRIHVDDIAGACLHLMHRAADGPGPAIVNVSDDCPAAPQDLLLYGADLLKCELPEEEPFDVASRSMSAMARSFWSENRRVRNTLLCRQLGYSLLHPDFKAGLQDCFRQEAQSRS